MKQNRYSNLIKVIFKLAVTVLFVYLVFTKVDFAETRRIFLQSNLLLLLAGLAVYLCSFLVSTRRSLLYLEDTGIRLGFTEGFRLYLEGVLYNLILPGGVGGDGYKLFVLRKNSGISGKKIFRAFFFERLSGLWAICLILACLAFLMPRTVIPPEWLLAAVTAGTIVYYLVMRRFFPEHAGRFIRAHSLSILVQCLVMLTVICILKAQEKPVDLPAYLFSFQGSTIFSILNIGLSGLGVREFAMSYASDFLHTDPAISVFVASVFWIISTVAALPGLWSIYRGDRKEFMKAGRSWQEETDGNRE
jgi:hypothetical protein